ncbi:hypothetical protein FACS1894188_12500 [Clostridia bacterium]|nr:hypothetical protein FACS1894188_12500 [Clostridia bacterium]
MNTEFVPTGKETVQAFDLGEITEVSIDTVNKVAETGVYGDDVVFDDGELDEEWEVVS